jgi:formylglycine-generating enzyme required for sulfatase activity
MDPRADLLWTLADPAASLEARLSAGEALALLGDARATVIDRVLVPGGPFLYGGHHAEDGSLQTPPRTVHLSSFSIDRYPVTVAAYAEMIEAGVYRERRHWSRGGWAWRTREGVEKPRFWGEAEWAPYLVPNHPVVGVSAYEAEAYASFRGARLPTQAEWEKACRGGDGRRYPWGDAWIDDACGVRGVGPRCTVPVGSFPRGASPLGVSDMVGCVWQWCADAADEDAEVDDEDPFVDPEGYDEATERVTRGGGWNNLRWSLSCTSKNGFPPGARFSNLGFRCVSA